MWLGSVSSARDTIPSCRRRTRLLRHNPGLARREWLGGLLALVVLAVLVEFVSDLAVGSVGPGVLALAAGGSTDRSSPLERLTDDVRAFDARLDDGDVGDQPLPEGEFRLDRDDELGELSAAIDDLTSTVAERTRRLAARERHREAVHRIAAESDDDGETVERLLELGCNRLDADAGVVFRSDENADAAVEFAHWNGVDEDRRAALERALSRPHWRRTLESETSMAMSDVDEDLVKADPSAGADTDGRCLGWPLEVDDDRYWTLCFVEYDAREQPVVDHERRFLEVVGREVSRVLERWVANRTRRDDERDLRERTEWLNAIVEASPAALVAVDLEDTVRLWNPAAERIFGWSEAEVIGEPLPTVPDDCKSEFDIFLERLRAGEIVTGVELERQTRDGSTVDVSLSKAPIRDTDDEIVGMMGVLEDVSERKTTERRLHERERELSTLMSNVPGMVYRCANEPDWPFEFVSEGALELTGYEPEKLVDGTVNWAEDVMLEDHDELRKTVQQAVDERETFQATFPIQTADGERRWVKEQGGGVFDDDGSLEHLEGVIIDVTEQVENKHELERTQRLLEQTKQLASVGGWELDVTEEPYNLRWTAETGRIYGLEPDVEMTLEEAIEFYHPEDLPTVQSAVDRAISEGESYECEVRLLTAGGNQRWVRILGEPVREDGEVVTIHGSIQDITDRKERERELERSETIIQVLDELVYEVDDEGCFTFLNDAITPILGYESEELLGEHVSTVMTESDVETAQERIRELLRANDPSQTFEITLRTKDGEEVHVENHMALLPLTDGEFQGTVGVLRDVTDRKERERELERMRTLLEQSQQMANVGGWELDVAEEPYEARATGEAARIHGVEPDELELGVGLDHYHPDHRPRLRSAIDEAIRDGEAYDLEARFITEQGEHRWVRSLAEPVVEDGEIVAVRGTIQDITDRKERERELERTRALLERVEHLASIGGWELDLRTEPPVPTWTTELYQLHGLPQDTEPDLSMAIDQYHPEDRARVRQTLEAAISSETVYDIEARMQPTPGETRWVRVFGVPVYEDGDLIKYQGALQDVTDLKQRELTLESLHEAARGLLGAETADDVAEIVIDAAEDVLEATGVALYRLDAEVNRLVPIAHTDAFDRLSSDDPSATVGNGDSVLWNAFVTGAQTVVDDPTAFDRSQVFDAVVESAVVVPVGDHGVLTAASDGAPIDAQSRRSIETLVATIEAAFDRLESEANLRERDAELEARNRRLRRQITINDTIRRVNQSLIGATSRAEIERTVPERLVEADGVAFAWIGRPDAADASLEPVAWAGSNEEYLDRISLDVAGSTEPSCKTARSDEPSVVENVIEDLQHESWRRQALDAGFQSAISVPLELEEYSYGVLTVYATEPDAFTALEQTVFTELGEAIANAVTATKTREALHAETLVELTLSLSDSSDVLSRIASLTDARVAFDGLGTNTGEDTVLFFETRGSSPDAVSEVLADLVSVSEHQLISHDEDRCRFEALVAGDTLASRLVRHGASPRTIRADGDETVVTVDVPTGTDVREFVAVVADHHGEVDLRSRQHVERTMHTRRELVTALFDELTDRQLEVLRTAYFAGFFEWPRESTGEDVAEMLDVSQPTVNRHLRIAQQRLLTQLFEPETATPAEREAS
ncbi:diguanylate cyclase/phosphodiesterase (GGDEF &EAL domains) with PAS/PAC sensor(s) [Natrarchaeobaculum sulfurireducens]|uniref:histidine kinase n=1 Tax=Natrarchaeobaculum sulfurireducens TaxID=2044521 RepID=A0A346PVC1_9EURY|nr:diguanylate cyclase/phosphodiesterase (GGDEF &EAL domains) with PAS/PAC sensor(s) [Natrarchaeobaculum sulfurireducens]